MIVEYMLISGIEYNYDNIIYLMTLKAFNGGKTAIYESKHGVFVACKFNIGKKELKQLYRDIKKATKAKYIESRYYENNS